MPPIRRLTVLQESSAPDDGRPAWHWTLIGALFTLSIWLPLAMLGMWVVARFILPAREHMTMDPELLFVLFFVPLITFGLASLAAGALVGRFGNRAGVKEAAGGSALAGAIGALVTLFQGDWRPVLSSFAVLVLVGAGAGWLGGRLGWARRPLAERRPRG
ncbi:MAG: hypothetical protein ABW133_19455 [Polyangiaceae bacterium]